MTRYSFRREPTARVGAIVGGSISCKYRFTVLTEGLIRLEWADDCQFEDRASVFAINRRLPIPDFRVEEDDGIVQIFSSRFHLTYDKDNFSPNGLTAVIRGNPGRQSHTWRYGEKSSNLGGTARTLDGADGRTPLEPGIMSRLGIAALDDSHSMLFDGNNWIATRRPGNRVDLYLFTYGQDYREAIKAFYTVSGPQPLLPRWAFGNWWSRYHPYSDHEYLALLDRFRSKNVPLSVAVLDMDWHLGHDDERVRKAGVSGWTGYTWNEKLFSNPASFLSELHHRGLRTSLNDHPADGIHSYEEPYEDVAKALSHDTSKGDPITFDITNQAFCNAFFDILHRRFEKQGVDFWWIDWQQGTYCRIPGVDPLWMLNHFHFLDSSNEGKRPITFSRYAGPGSHRYPVGFSGDTVITWESLDFQPEFTATASNIGFGWWSHDIGGHMHGYKDDELLIRWVQLGVFSPIMRLHSCRGPWSIKEPWKLEPQYELIMSDYLRLRHRLVPYLYTMNVFAMQKASPLVQPLYWANPDRAEAYKYPNEYMFGSALLVIPITSPQEPRSRRAEVVAWFPPGRHVDVFTGAVYDGDRELILTRCLADYPAFAREGAIIPFDGSLELANDCVNPDEIEVVVVVGADGKFELFEDEEASQHTLQVNLRQTPISFTQKTGELVVGPIQGAPSSMQRKWSVRLVGYSPPADIPAQLYVDGAEKVVVSEKASNGTLLKLGAWSLDRELVLKLGKDPQLDIIDPLGPIYEFVKETQIALDLKKSIWGIIDNKKSSTTVKVGQLTALKLEPRFLNPLLESLLADSRSAR